jgi:hypothetical protein
LRLNEAVGFLYIIGCSNIGQSIFKWFLHMSINGFLAAFFIAVFILIGVGAAITDVCPNKSTIDGCK